MKQTLLTICLLLFAQPVWSNNSALNLICNSLGPANGFYDYKFSENLHDFSREELLVEINLDNKICLLTRDGVFMHYHSDGPNFTLYESDDFFSCIKARGTVNIHIISLSINRYNGNLIYKIEETMNPKLVNVKQRFSCKKNNKNKKLF